MTRRGRSEIRCGQESVESSPIYRTPGIVDLPFVERRARARIMRLNVTSSSHGLCEKKARSPTPKSNDRDYLLAGKSLRPRPKRGSPSPLIH
uniref:Uncharacterized protein n=1 Tax=Steinernema glaseri TaxID=37863 RepID=A0A1I8A4S1_9BILA